jgi:hypothetical protein
MAADIIDAERAILQADGMKLLARLEYVRGQGKWEFSPASRHQRAIDQIRASLKPKSGGGTSSCCCHSLSDVLIRFRDPDQSLKRPDVAIFCEEPPDTDHALDVLPVAVIEILSVGNEDKDLGVDGAPFYIEQGIADAVVFDPRSGEVRHYQPGQPFVTHVAPLTLSLACGCDVAF